MKNNPYIQLVQDSKLILHEKEDILTRKWKWNEYFANANDIVLEIWTWLWNFFAKQVQENQDKNFIWLEIRYKRLWLTQEKSLWNKATYAYNSAHKHLENNFCLLKIYWQDIYNIFAKDELSECYILFPDPWAKKKSQRKNRLLQRNFLHDLYEVTKLWGTCTIRTDHCEYFDFALEELSKTDWKIQEKSYDYEHDPDFQNAETTEFQQMFRGQKIKIHHLKLQK